MIAASFMLERETDQSFHFPYRIFHLSLPEMFFSDGK